MTNEEIQAIEDEALLKLVDTPEDLVLLKELLAESEASISRGNHA